MSKFNSDKDLNIFNCLIIYISKVFTYWQTLLVESFIQFIIYQKLHLILLITDKTRIMDHD